jgi:hypothetical protein
MVCAKLLWITTDLRLVWSIISNEITRKFCLRHNIQTRTGVQSASYSMGTEGLIHWCNATEREANHSPSSSAEVKDT